MALRAPSGGRITGFFHAGVTVRDIEASLNFYRDLLGLEVRSDVVIDHPYLFNIVAVAGEAVRIAYLAVTEDVFIELLEYRGIERHPASARPCDFGSGHLCVYVEGLAALDARLREAGVTMRSTAPVRVEAGPRAGATVVYAADPDGYIVELFERPRADPEVVHEQA